MSFDIPESTESRYLYICNILSQRAWMDDHKYLREHWNNDPEERLSVVLPEVFAIKKNGGTLSKECKSGETRRLYHIVAEALDLYHTSSNAWTPLGSEDYTPQCKYCAIKRSAREERRSGIIVSSEPFKLKRRDERSRNKAFQRNFEAARNMGIRWVARPKKYV
ncbi:hypothetical protein LAU_0151 [Lausannevirus]|uniref:Uncharacterized protein n=1 Tax=Lausannevirus TaxID=999883 RepID=F2WL79_9VIRU|nr:hypothetical protein LAU_0151 [Lausannevirus]AEA07002.1 hypothetical protein LAU_0151 [Lausannevirus]